MASNKQPQWVNMASSEMTAEFRLEGSFKFWTPIKTTWTLISSDHEFIGPVALTWDRLYPAPWV